MKDHTGRSITDPIPACPQTPYDPDASGRILSAAATYLEHAGELIYSFGSKTFLSGYDICDPAHGNRGNIDCSTFVLLVLSGIPYENSPYATGTAEGLAESAVTPPSPELIDFSALPDRFVGIAERIGFPELAGPKGLDLDKMAALGLDPQELGKRIRKTGVSRRSASLAGYCLARGDGFLDAQHAAPGDLVFYRSSGFYTEGSHIYKGEAEISHVGIIWHDTSLMINSSGSFRKDPEEKDAQSAVSLAPVSGAKTPAFFARPAHFSDL